MTDTKTIFYFPVDKNKITANDIKRSQLRITVDFKKFFPPQSCNITAVIRGVTSEVSYTIQEKRSDILRFEKDSYSRLELKDGGRVKITKLGTTHFQFEKVK